MNCGTCVWWQDYSDRVDAIISTGHSNCHRNRIELRRCRYNPPPTVESVTACWTDSEYVCGSYRKVGA
jgi:hypothetical protein